MIDTALFSWKRHGDLTLHEAFLWTASVHYARRSGMGTILCGDAGAQEILAGELGLPFGEVLDLPEIPAELEHVRDLVKLHALRMRPKSVHVDFDAYLGDPLPAHVMAAPFFGEFFYTPENAACQFNQVREMRAEMGAPGPEPQRGMAGGIFGGTATAEIVAVIDRSLDLALRPENRAALRRRDGYTTSIWAGEMAFGTAFPDAAELLPGGPHDHAAYRARNYVHVAGHKTDPAMLDRALRRALGDFPAAIRETFQRWSKM